MKKIFLFAAAAMVSLSSCVKTNEVYTGGVQEIGFKSAVTKAAIDGTTFEGSMTVAAVWDAEKDGSYVEYFAPYKFTGTASTPWAGDPDAKYWPNAGQMQFLACYPYGIGTFTADYTGNVLAGYKVTGIANKTAQNDVLYSNLLTCDAPQESAQALLFHHALSLLKVTFATNVPTEVVKIVSVSVADVVFDGDLAVTAGSPSTAAWSNEGTPEDYTFQNVDTTNQLTATADEDATPLLILPAAAQTSMTIVYTLNGHEMTKTVDLSAYGAWDQGKKYIYNFTIGAKEIKFTCTVDTWTDVVVGGGITI